MRILLTGASGFLGRNFILSAPPHWTLASVYANDTSFPEFVRGIGRSNVTAVRCDLTNAEQVKAMVCEHGRDWDCCLHLACKVDIPWSMREPKQDLLVNAGSLLNVLAEVRAEHFIYMSSGAVYDGLEGEVQPGVPLNPTLPYAIAKLTCEQYVECYCERKRTISAFTIIRFFGAYGPYEAAHKIYTRLVRAFAMERQSGFTLYGDGSNLIDAMYVDDAIRALQRVVNGACRNQIVDLAAGNPMRIDALIHEVARIAGVTSVQITREGIAHENIRFRASTKAMQCNGFEPTVKLDEGINNFLSFLLRQRNQPTASHKPLLQAVGQLDP